jgi:hypothetical protein
MESEASGASTLQPRRCGISRCTRVVDPASRWKLCDACRLKYRKYQRKRLGVANPRTGVDDRSRAEIAMTESNVRQLHDLSHIYTCNGIALMTFFQAVLEANKSRECSSNWCRIRIPLQEEYSWKRCVKCRVRGRWGVKRRRVIGQHYEIGHAHVGLAHHVLHEFQRQRRRRQKVGLDLELPVSYSFRSKLALAHHDVELRWLSSQKVRTERKKFPRRR